MNGKTLLTMGIDPDNDVPVNSCDLGFRHRTNTHLSHPSLNQIVSDPMLSDLYFQLERCVMLTFTVHY